MLNAFRGFIYLLVMLSFSYPAALASNPEGPTFVLTPPFINLIGLPGNRVDQPVVIHNNSSTSVTFVLSESTVVAGPEGHVSGSPIDFMSFIPSLRSQVKGIQPVVSPEVDPEVFVTAVVDPRGDNLPGGVDVLEIQYQKRTTILGSVLDLRMIMISPDSNLAGFISLDIDQDFGTGIWPTPWQLGPRARDVGSEFEILLDAGGLLADSLGLGNTPIAVIFRTTDTSVAYIPIIPTIVRDSLLRITVSGIPFGSFGINDPDQNLNISAVFARLNATSPFPDYAPNLGHGIVGSETGTSWVRTDRTSVTIPASDSATVLVSVLAAKPPGTYATVIRFTATGHPVVQLPIAVSVAAAGNGIINVSPSSIIDTIPSGLRRTHNVTIQNLGNGDLIWGTLDTASIAWLVTDPPGGVLAPGSFESLSVEMITDGLVPGTAYHALILVISNDPVNGVVQLPVTMQVDQSTGITGDPLTLPAETNLDQNYPNPFNPTTAIRFDLASQGVVDLRVYNILGQHVATLLSGLFPEGTHIAHFDGSSFGSGAYIYELRTRNSLLRRSMLLVR